MTRIYDHLNDPSKHPKIEGQRTNDELDALYTAVAGAVTYANPTASVGLTAVNGAATTVMRSDAAPALSQSIAPTWTGVHAFSNTTDSTSKTTGAVTISGGIGIAKKAYFGANPHYNFVTGVGAGFWLDDTTNPDRFFFGSDATAAELFRIFSVATGTNIAQFDCSSGTHVGLSIAGQLALTGSSFGNLSVQGTNASTSTTTGCAAFSGGVGIAGDEFVGGKIVSVSPTSGVGYATGAGSTVTQSTNKTTGVTLNKVCGQITTDSSGIVAGQSQGFTFTNSAIAATDVIVISMASGGTVNSYNVWVDAVAAGSCHITMHNKSAGNLSEALVLNFAVIKAVTS